MENTTITTDATVTPVAPAVVPDDATGPFVYTHDAYDLIPMNLHTPLVVLFKWLTGEPLSALDSLACTLPHHPFVPFSHSMLSVGIVDLLRTFIDVAKEANIINYRGRCPAIPQCESLSDRFSRVIDFYTKCMPNPDILRKIMEGEIKPTSRSAYAPPAMFPDAPSQEYDAEFELDVLYFLTSLVIGNNLGIACSGERMPICSANRSGLFAETLVTSVTMWLDRICIFYSKAAITALGGESTDNPELLAAVSPGGCLPQMADQLNILKTCITPATVSTCLWKLFSTYDINFVSFMKYTPFSEHVIPKMSFNIMDSMPQDSLEVYKYLTEKDPLKLPFGFCAKLALLPDSHQIVRLPTPYALSHLVEEFLQSNNNNTQAEVSFEAVSNLQIMFDKWRLFKIQCILETECLALGPAPPPPLPPTTTTTNNSASTSSLGSAPVSAPVSAPTVVPMPSLMPVHILGLKTFWSLVEQYKESVSKLTGGAVVKGKLAERKNEEELRTLFDWIFATWPVDSNILARLCGQKMERFVSPLVFRIAKLSIRDGCPHQFVGYNSSVTRPFNATEAAMILDDLENIDDRIILLHTFMSINAKKDTSTPTSHSNFPMQENLSLGPGEKEEEPAEGRHGNRKPLPPPPPPPQPPPLSPTLPNFDNHNEIILPPQNSYLDLDEPNGLGQGFI